MSIVIVTKRFECESTTRTNHLHHSYESAMLIYLSTIERKNCEGVRDALDSIFHNSVLILRQSFLLLKKHSLTDMENKIRFRYQAQTFEAEIVVCWRSKDRGESEDEHRRNQVFIGPVRRTRMIHELRDVF